MTRSQILEWLELEFKPLCLATPVETQMQVIENAIRYWNTHSAYKAIQMVNAATGQTVVDVNADIKRVVEVWPGNQTDWIFNDHPLWSLLGITILDNVTQDLILMAETFRNYRKYVSTEFKWTFVANPDPTGTGRLYVSHLPKSTTTLALVGTHRILPTQDDIDQEHILDWILYYSKALLKQIEGNTLRKSAVIGINNDGQSLFDEGSREKEDLEDRLKSEGRWVVMARRF